MRRNSGQSEVDRKHEKYERLLAVAKVLEPLPTVLSASGDTSKLKFR